MFGVKSSRVGDAGSRISARFIGVVVVAGVIAVPGIPAGYSTPLAIFAGAAVVFFLEGRRYRQMRRKRD